MATRDGRRIINYLRRLANSVEKGKTDLHQIDQERDVKQAAFGDGFVVTDERVVFHIRKVSGKRAAGK